MTGGGVKGGRGIWRSLIAVLAGNAIYLVVEHWLPVRARHVPYNIDWGLAIDFWICVAVYGVLGFFHRFR